jgi:Mg-chelatase subunit ChlI
MDEIDTIVNNLVVNKDILEQKINDIEGKKDEFNSKYTPSSMKNLNSKVDEARELLSKDSISVDEMKKILSDIADSINSLTEKSNKTELEKLLKDVENLDKNTYTDDTVKKLENVYQGSKDVNANGDATQTEVDNSVRSLKEDIEALKKKENDNKENNNNDNDNKEDNNKEDNNMEDEKQEENNNNEEKNNTNNKQEQTSVVENKKNDNNVNAPKTGDMYIIIYGSLLVIAIITFIVTIVYNKRKNKQK